uniref:Uncharacterized protein n=1 Tax=candidate division WOR-3 bacterium TaxID=2052148 RepID=A0A7C6EFH5_UNCW3
MASGAWACKKIPNLKLQTNFNYPLQNIWSKVGQGFSLGNESKIKGRIFGNVDRNMNAKPPITAEK